MGVLCWSGVFSFEFSYPHPLHHHHDPWSMIRKQGAPFLHLKLILWCVVRSYLGNVHTALTVVIKSFLSSSWCWRWWWWWGSKDFPFVTFFLGWPVWGIYYTQSLQNISSSASFWAPQDPLGTYSIRGGVNSVSSQALNLAIASTWALQV